MSTARRLVSHRPGRMELERHDIPDEPPPGGILVRADVTLISPGTEVANYLGRTAQRTLTSTEPYHPGYSCAGVVEAVGEGVDAFRPGDRICGPLPHTSWAVEDRPERLARMTTIPEGVTARQAAMTQLACIALNAVRPAAIQLGDRVAVVGAGLVGLLAARFARLDGAHRLAVVELLAPRREAARTTGADLVADPADPDTDQRMHALAPDGFDVVVEATGAPSAFVPALELAARGGRVVLLGSTRGRVENFDPYSALHLKGLHVIGAHVSTAPKSATVHDRWTEAANRRLILELIRDGALEVDSLITDVVPPDQGGEAFRALAEEPAGHLGVVIDWSA
ncbi:zinc-binding dehydrogenase [Streptomyces sp. NPDC056568]|uniref:zinc-dependent alcohol dehydrogenase n=1 Tax=Streptomyces sp. NPDC056568 TaxID=3345866 RepID=UPI0036A3DC39